MAWDKRQVKDFVKRVRDRVGDGWEFFVPSVREAFIGNEALSIVISQHAETVTVAAIEKLRKDMMEEAGVWEAE